MNYIDTYDYIFNLSDNSEIRLYLICYDGKGIDFKDVMILQ